MKTMKRILLLVACTLLLLFALAPPALADADYYFVYVYDGSVFAVDETAHTVQDVGAIPPGSSVVCGYSWVGINRGLATTFPQAALMRLTVTGPGGTIVGQCDETNCAAFWGGTYLWNDWYADPTWWAFPYNPKVAAGPWARDWVVPCGNLPTGDYTIAYSDKFVRAMADPMWERPGTYPPVYHAYDWYDWEGPKTFVVE
jgi:hypothetical protein